MMKEIKLGENVVSLGKENACSVQNEFAQRVVKLIDEYEEELNTAEVSGILFGMAVKVIQYEG